MRNSGNISKPSIEIIKNDSKEFRDTTFKCRWRMMDVKKMLVQTETAVAVMESI